MQQQKAMFSIFDLPVHLRRKQLNKLSSKDKKEITSLFFIKEIIQDAFKKQSKVLQDAIKRKRREGYCGGFIYCMNYSGDEYMCRGCKRQKTNPSYHRRQSEYGRMRERERKMVKTSGNG